ncbi:hypothetical protein OS493_004585 [Desmophyllum pertusum]|uniref:Uncharacterized protein n=1 Tax=Desmophyllum pertusum TaxID=174260 RepID=A0A9W9ZGA7_9CNID|nr:hypothetical protein OS493_004585 [Desmophyllum pertusum]
MSVATDLFQLAWRDSRIRAQLTKAFHMFSVKNCFSSLRSRFDRSSVALVCNTVSPTDLGSTVGIHSNKLEVVGNLRITGAQTSHLDLCVFPYIIVGPVDKRDSGSPLVGSSGWTDFSQRGDVRVNLDQQSRAE